MGMKSTFDCLNRFGEQTMLIVMYLSLFVGTSDGLLSLLDLVFSVAVY